MSQDLITNNLHHNNFFWPTYISELGHPINELLKYSGLHVYLSQRAPTLLLDIFDLIL